MEYLYIKNMDLKILEPYACTCGSDPQIHYYYSPVLIANAEQMIILNLKTLYVHGMSEMDKQIFEEDGEICVADDGGQNVIFIYDPYTKKLIGMLDMSYSATCLIKKEKLYE